MSTKVLVVEDDYLCRFMMQELVQSVGVACEVAADGQQCLDRLKTGPADFDVILMDVHMPRVSGLEATEAIRNDQEHPANNVPIVAVTADRHWLERDHYEAAGFNAVLPKPVELTDLTELVQKFAAE